VINEGTSYWNPFLETLPREKLQQIELKNFRNILTIGCKACIEACPFGAMQFNESQETAMKCDLCIERQK